MEWKKSREEHSSSEILIILNEGNTQLVNVKMIIFEFVELKNY